MKKIPAMLLLAWAPMWLAPTTEARVVRVEIERREAVLAGRPFGLAGAYEKLIGTVHYAVDPDNFHNRTVVDIDRAPVNAAGEVEFAADFYVLKPKDPAKGNGSLFMEIPNRGGKAMLGLLNVARGSLDPTEAEHFGDGLLLRRGSRWSGSAGSSTRVTRQGECGSPRRLRLARPGWCARTSSFPRRRPSNRWAT
jgi:hypothetical protein